MIDYLFSSQLPGKGADLAETGLSSIIANIALIVGGIIIKPAIERRFHLAIGGHTPTILDNRQPFKAVLHPRHDLLSPALDGLSTLHLKVKPTKATIATAVTVVKAVPTPVQIFQEQSSIAPILGIFACMILALVGTVLTFQHYRQSASWSSPSSASSDNSGSSLEPYSRGSTPPNDDSSDESSGSDGHPPPVPVFDVFYDFPILHLDKAINTGDEQVRDKDGAPPPPPPSFPTPVEDGDAFNSKPSISKWLSLTLVLSIISFVIKRFFKGYGKTQNEVSTPTVSERIAIKEISGDVVTLFSSSTPKPVININSTCLNLLPLVEIETESLSISTMVTSTISQRSRKSMTVIFSLLFVACLFGLPFIAQYFLDYHLQRTTNSFLPMAIRRPSLDEINVSVAGVNVDTSGNEETDNIGTSNNIISGTDDAAGSDEANTATGGDEETDDLMKNSVQQELSFNNVGDNTLNVFEKASPLAVDLEDILDASEDGVPFLEVFHALSISGSSDENPVSNEKPETSTLPMIRLPTTGEKCTVNGKGIKALSEHVPKSNIPVLAKRVQTVSAPARAETLPVRVKSSTTDRKTSSKESLNPKATSFVPPSHVPVRRQSSSLSLHYCYSPPSPTRPGLSASIHAPIPRRRGLSASIHAPRSPLEEGLSASIYAPSSPPRPDSSTSIHPPCTPPRRGLSASIHAPSQQERMELVPIPVIDLSPERRVRRVIDPQRECDLVVLVSGGPVSP